MEDRVLRRSLEYAVHEEGLVCSKAECGAKIDRKIGAIRTDEGDLCRECHGKVLNQRAAQKKSETAAKKLAKAARAKCTA